MTRDCFALAFKWHIYIQTGRHYICNFKLKLINLIIQPGSCAFRNGHYCIGWSVHLRITIYYCRMPRTCWYSTSIWTWLFIILRIFGILCASVPLAVSYSPLRWTASGPTWFIIYTIGMCRDLTSDTNTNR